MSTSPPGADSGVAFLLTRVFDAPRERVFQAWSEAERLEKWWGAKGFGMRVATLEFRPGGVFHYAMKLPDGREIWGKFVYQEIQTPEKIVFVNGFADEAGNPIRNPFAPIWPLEVMNTMTLSEQAGKTTLTLRGVPQNASDAERALFAAARPSMQQGFTGTFDQLDAYLARIG